MSERIGFISTRFAGTDGVSLESAKWAEVLWADRHVSYWYGGRLDRAPAMSHCVPEAYFGHPENLWINERIWGKTTRSRLVSQRVRDMAEYLKGTLYRFVEQFDLTILILENAVTIPMHVPLGVALAEFLVETKMAAIVHHHDFYWERPRFLINAAHDYLDLAFPPRDLDIHHVVINQTAREELSWRKGVSSILVPNVVDFENAPAATDHYAADVRAELGLTEDDIMVLQPTRVVPRKGIEHAIKLIQLIGDPRYKLVVSHDAGDEGMEYAEVMSELAHEAGVDLRFMSTRIADVRQYDVDGRKIYTLWDLYPHADLVTYFSLYEGFGNAFLEAVYFRVPVVVNRYSIFTRDIEPKGFRVPTIDGFPTRAVANEVRRLMDDFEYRREMVDHNYNVARGFFSYAVLRHKLRELIADIHGQGNGMP